MAGRAGNSSWRLCRRTTWSTFGVTTYWRGVSFSTLPTFFSRSSMGITSKSTSRKRSRLVGIAIHEDSAHRREEDADVEPERPPLDIFLVQLYPALCALDCADLAAQALDLGKSSQAGADAMTASVAAHGLLIITVADLHLQRMRPRPDDRHVAADDVEQLRQLVDAQAA